MANSVANDSVEGVAPPGSAVSGNQALVRQADNRSIESVKSSEL